MEENPRKSGSKDWATGARHQYREEDESAGGDQIKCSGKSCRSCTGGMIADCVALCCCPCGVVNILTLALFKAPFMMGRRCLGEKKRKSCGDEIKNHEEIVVGKEKEGMGVENQNQRTSETGLGEEEVEKDNESYSARFEAEKVWLELNQLGQLGFGRVS